MQSYRRRSVCTVARAVCPAPSTSPRLGDEYGWAVVWGPGRWGAAGRDSEVVPVWAAPWAVRHLCWSAVVLKVLSNLAAGLRGGTLSHTQIWAPGERDGVWTLWRGKAGAGAGRVCVGSLACSGIWHHCAASLSCVRPSGPFTLARRQQGWGENNRLPAPGRGRGGGTPPTLELAKH
jgi:hypothetical protein